MKQPSKYINGFTGRNFVKGVPGQPKYTREEDRKMSQQNREKASALEKELADYTLDAPELPDWVVVHHPQLVSNNMLAAQIKAVQKDSQRRFPKTEEGIAKRMKRLTNQKKSSKDKHKRQLLKKKIIELVVWRTCKEFKESKEKDVEKENSSVHM